MTAINRVGDSLKAAVEQNIINPASEEYELTQAQTKRIVRDSHKEVETKIEKIKGDFEQQRKIAEVKHEEAIKQASNERDLEDAEKTFRKEMESALKGVNDAIKKLPTRLSTISQRRSSNALRKTRKSGEKIVWKKKFVLICAALLERFQASSWHTMRDILRSTILTRTLRMKSSKRSPVLHSMNSAS